MEEDDPRVLAAAFLSGRSAGHRCGVLYLAGAFYTWQGAHWRPRTEEDVLPLVYEAANRHAVWLNKLDREQHEQAKAGGSPPKVIRMTNTLASNVVGALRGRGHVSDLIPPRWLPGATGPAVSELVSVANGLVHLPAYPAYAAALEAGTAGGLLSHTPDFFATATGGFKVDPHAPEPAAWFKFLGELWPTDPQSRELLQEWMGHLLVPDNRFQKYLSLRGPGRSGKGTIPEVIAALVGPHAYLPVEPEDFVSSFGKELMPGMLVTAILTAQLDKQDRNLTAIAQHIKSRAGNRTGGQMLNAMNKKHRKVRLVNRTAIAHNEELPLRDKSGVLGKRASRLRLYKSFMGREDPDLFERQFAPELPGIFNWAVRGWARLMRNRRFTESPAGLWDPRYRGEYEGSANLLPYQHDVTVIDRDSQGNPIPDPANPGFPLLAAARAAPPGHAKLKTLRAERLPRVRTPHPARRTWYWRLTAVIEFDDSTFTDNNGAVQATRWRAVLPDAGSCGTAGGTPS